MAGGSHDSPSLFPFQKARKLQRRKFKRSRGKSGISCGCWPASIAACVTALGLVYTLSAAIHVAPIHEGDDASSSRQMGAVDRQARSSSPPVDQILGSITSGQEQEEAAKGVLSRLLGEAYLPWFQFVFIDEEECGGRPCFEVTTARGRRGEEEGVIVSVRGTSGVDMASGLHWYLKYECGAHVSWHKTGGTQLVTIPSPTHLPLIKDNGSLTKIRPVRWSYYQNVCTFSYSAVWWDWKRWEKEIDWMALQGVNLPLAFTAQEAIWRKVWTRPEFGLSDADLHGHFGGPGFLAWARMGNLKGWGGPLSQKWHEAQLQLQKLILARMHSLGMTPVLPAFSGQVPNALHRKFPDANITVLNNWGSVDNNPKWCCTDLLDAKDPLFARIGKAFIEQQMQEYGRTSHVYNCDTFNEMTPPTSNPSYIASTTAAVFNGMVAADPDAVWLMQGWLFRDTFWQPPQMEALLHAVPRGRLVVLDLFADVAPVWQRSNAFQGVPFIWCMLHNFGGNLEMYGDLESVASGPVLARRAPGGAMVGVGMCPEGIEQNPIVYDLMAEMAFRDQPPDLSSGGANQPAGWVSAYVTRRYGAFSSHALQAWSILASTLYNCTDGHENHNHDVLAWFPDIHPSIFEVPHPELLTGAEGSAYGPPAGSPNLWYEPRKVLKAWSLLLKAGNDLPHSATYLYDVVDVGRQVLSKLVNVVYEHMLVAFLMGNELRTTYEGRTFVKIMEDLDALLGTRPELLLGTWLEDAKATAMDDAERKLYEWNARTQVTMWLDALPNRPSVLHDYANKHWSGLVGGYYLARWKAFINMLVDSAHNSRAFPYEEWLRQWVALTKEWQEGSELYDTQPKGDALALAQRCYKRWASYVVSVNSGTLEEHISTHT